MRIRILTIMTAMLVAMLFSCSTIKEDMDDCPSYSVRLLVVADIDYDADADAGRAMSRAANPDRYDIESVWVYAFDGVGNYLTSWNGGAYTLGQEYEVPIPLEPGDYQFVVWTNQHAVNDIQHYCNSHDMLDGSDIDDLNMFLDASKYTNSDIDVNIPDLHYGYKTVTVESDEDQEIQVIIRPSTYKVTFTVRGLSANMTDEYDFVVSADEYMRDFRNVKVTAATSAPFRYVRSDSFDTPDDEMLEVSMIMVGLEDLSHTLQFQLTRKGSPDEVLYPRETNTGDLRQLIIDAYKAQNNGAEPNFDETFEFLVPLWYDTRLGMLLDLRAWSYEEDEWVLN